MLRKPNNVFSVILDDRTNAASALPSVGTVVTDANLAAGAICMVDVGMRRIAASTPSGGGYNVVDRYRIVQGKGAGNPLMISPVITKANATISTSVHKPAVQQITTVGFNGSTGALPEANDTSFFIKIRKNDNDAANRSQPMSLFAGPVKTDASGTQEELAFALIANGIANFAKEPANGYIRFEALINNAGAAITGTVANFGVTYGSRSVTLDGTVTNVAVGDVLVLDGIAYKVAAVASPNTVTLESAYQGATATIAVASVKRVLAATAATADFGVRISGVAADFDVNAFRDYYANRFTVTFSDPTTPVTHIAGARNGNGVWQQVAMDEYMSYGYEGQNDMLAVPPRFRDQEVKIPGVGGETALTSKYSCVSLEWEEGISGLVSMAGGKGTVLFYANLKNGAGDKGDLGGTASSGEQLVAALGLTPADLDEL